MYRKKDTTPEFANMELAFGGKLRKDNRWVVVLAELIPWDEVEKRQAEILNPGSGRPALPLSVRVALGACIIKEKLKATDEEVCCAPSSRHNPKDLKVEFPNLAFL